jgi:hypothetical protein
VASSFTDDDVRQHPAISSEQHAAASAPGKRTSDLVGNFGDFAALFEQLEEPAVMELGKPLPKENYLPRRRIGSCPSAHNRALLDDLARVPQRPATKSQIRKARSPAAGGS